jgi:hypothetical protein
MSESDHPPLVLTGEKHLITERKSGYASKVGNQGYTGPDNQVHHVLPCGSSTKSKDEFIDKQLDKAPRAREMVEQTTHYNVNEKPNLLGLPTRAVYAAKFATPLGIMPHLLTIAADDPKVVACNLPVHLWGHIGYSKFAKVQTDKVWVNVNLKVDEEHKPVAADDVGEDIQTVSDDLRSNVVAPTRKRTKEAWASGNRAVFDIFPFI